MVLKKVSWLIIFPFHCIWDTCVTECSRLTIMEDEKISVQFSYSVTSDSLWPHGPQHASLPCPSPTPDAYSNSCPSSWWCHPTISSTIVPFSSELQSFPASGSFPVSQLLSDGQSIGNFSFSISPSNAYSGLISFRIDWSDFLALQGTLKMQFSLLYVPSHIDAPCSSFWIWFQS